MPKNTGGISYGNLLSIVKSLEERVALLEGEVKELKRAVGRVDTLTSPIASNTYVDNDKNESGSYEPPASWPVIKQKTYTEY